MSSLGSVPAHDDCQAELISSWTLALLLDGIFHFPFSISPIPWPSFVYIFSGVSFNFGRCEFAFLIRLLPFLHNSMSTCVRVASFAVARCCRIYLLLLPRLLAARDPGKTLT